jgi:primase-polymerase (primpol)-like protein
METLNIPSEMKQHKSFVVWRYENRGGPKPAKVPYNPNTGKQASVTDPATWAGFEEATAAAHNYSGIGFVLSENDPFACIDLDDPKGDAAAIAMQARIYGAFDSYAEVSPSGQGLHIWVKGAVPTGKRRGSVEVYSTARFMTLTGKVYRKESKP